MVLLQASQLNASPTIGRLFLSSDFSDIQFHLDEKESVHAHSAILSSVSRLVKKSLLSRKCHCSNTDCDDSRPSLHISLPGVGKTALEQILELAYTGKCSMRDEDELHAFHLVENLLECQFTMLDVVAIGDSEMDECITKEEWDACPNLELEADDTLRNDLEESCGDVAMPSQDEGEDERNHCDIIDGSVNEKSSNVFVESFAGQPEACNTGRDNSTGQKKMRCFACPFECERLATLKSHVMGIHFREKLFALNRRTLDGCFVCGKIKNQPANVVKTHVMSHAETIDSVVPEFNELCLASGHYQGIFQCNLCPKRFAFLEDFELHFCMSHHCEDVIAKNDGEKGFCTLCGQRFSRLADLFAHLVGGAHHWAGHFVSPKSHPQIFREHTAFMTSMKSWFQCALCHQVTASGREMKSHLSWHFAKELRSLNGEYVEKCGFCGKVLHSVNLLVKHVAFNHDKLKELVPAERIEASLARKSGHKCRRDDDDNSKAPIDQLEATTLPMAADTTKDDDTFHCYVCPKTFNSAFQGKGHLLRRHYSERALEVNHNKRRTCHRCGKRLSGWPALTMHMHYQHGLFREIVADYEERIGDRNGDRFPCRLCSKRFSFKEDLKAHVLEDHFAARVWELNRGEQNKCLWCSQVFPDSRSLFCHLSRHEDIARKIIDPEIFPELLRVAVYRTS